MKLSDLFTGDNIEVDFPRADKDAFLESIIKDLDARGYILDRDRVVGDIIERENVMSTGIGNGVAIPHAYTDGVDRLVAGFYRTIGGVDFDALDKNSVDLFFIILGPKESRRDHIKVLAKISRLLNHDDFREDLRKATDVDAVMHVFKRFGDK
ncbi:MAG: PTS sugar transporter subunit IIA [Candidatus Krumholzibacteria bacterium]|nr:PTS sugar transporter subunit IIA [Candidatus Krumholzibacteria bacterium]